MPKSIMRLTVNHIRDEFYKGVNQAPGENDESVKSLWAELVKQSDEIIKETLAWCG